MKPPLETPPRLISEPLLPELKTRLRDLVAMGPLGIQFADGDLMSKGLAYEFDDGSIDATKAGIALVTSAFGRWKAGQR